MSQQFDLRQVLLDSFNKTGVEWHIKGVVNGKGNLYTVSNDTKLISKVFELVAFPIIIEAVEPYIEKWESEERQTVYPDLTLVVAGDLPNKIAIDIKSTYRKASNRAGFTLGSYTAYMRPPFTKNIRYPYTQYREHWIVGFIYSRVPGVEPEVVNISNIDKVIAPITDVELIIREKWQIASDRPGSGNTTNIGSITEIEGLREGKGVFTKFEEKGKEIFEDYWRNFDRNPPRKYKSVDEYLAWRKEHPTTS
ncbi:MAG: restriction endonuclease [Chloroflexi bacterium]|nr:restriction endonuclease [Chloroflexota bacterium]